MNIPEFIEYAKQNWLNKPSKTTPITAERLNHIEEGIATNNKLLKELIEATTQLNSNLMTNNAGAHNAIYCGKSLGSTVTTAQYAAIKAGTFDDLYIGDYWTIGGVNYRIAGFDYYLHNGDTDTTKHHVVIVPDENMGSAQMNTTNVTTGGYVGSAMYKANLNAAKTKIKSAFSGHVLSHRVYLTNAVSNGAPSGGAWFDSEVELMTERMVYGCPVHSPMGDGQKDPWSAMHNYTVEKSQLPLFALNPAAIATRYDYWLRDVVNAANFAFVGNGGNAYHGYASDSLGVRPAFCIC